jgi:hypothetical protein
LLENDLTRTKLKYKKVIFDNWTHAKYYSVVYQIKETEDNQWQVGAFIFFTIPAGNAFDDKALFFILGIKEPTPELAFMRIHSMGMVFNNIAPSVLVLSHAGKLLHHWFLDKNNFNNDVSSEKTISCYVGNPPEPKKGTKTPTNEGTESIN